MRTLVSDVRVALRALRRKPAVPALALVSLAVAIGFSTAAFSVIDTYKLKSLAVGDPPELAAVYIRTREQRSDGFN